MKKALAFGALVMLAGCNTLKKSGDTGEGGATAESADGATTASGAPTATAGSIVDKALSFVAGGATFEGEITMNVSEHGKPQHTITYDVKGTQMRFDAPADNGPMSGGYVIFNSTNKSMVTVSDAKKMAFTIDLNRAPQPPSAAAKKPTIDRTGKMDTVAGYSCEIWKITNDDGSKGDVCVGKGIAFPSFGGRNSEAWMNELADSFPLRAVMTDAAGAEKTRMEVTKVDRKSIDDAKFQVPAGYQTMSMDQMLQGMGALQRRH
jgi:hypothetical protein